MEKKSQISFRLDISSAKCQGSKSSPILDRWESTKVYGKLVDFDVFESGNFRMYKKMVPVASSLS